jgi:hypothetical protein
MQPTRLLAVLSVVVLVALAGCSGGTTGADSPNGTETMEPTMTDTETQTETSTTTDGDGTETETPDGDGTETETPDGDGTETETPDGGTETPTPDGNASASVAFADQTVDEGTVTVRNATLPDGGFVVVHRVENGSPGAVIGNSTYLEPGTHENVVVPLDEPLESSTELVAMAHRDTNDNELYDFPDADGPYTTDGAPVVDSANVSVTNATPTATSTATTTDS